MLPRKVREQAERAERLHAEVYGNTGNTPAPAPAPAEAPPVEPAPAPVEPVPQDPTPEPTPAPAPAVADNWEEKYRVLDGKYKAEVPRMAQEIRGLKNTLDELREELQAAKAAPAPAPAPEALSVSGMSPAQVVEQFGEDFAKAVGAIASQIADERTNKVREEFKPELESVRKRTNETAREAFMRELAHLVPDWQQIDTDDGFTSYLDEMDELSGRSRRFFFQEADKHNDAHRVAWFFRSFKGKSAAPAPAAAAAPNPAVEALIAPSSNSTTQVPKGKRLWTQGDIRQFYVDVRKGRYSPQEVQRIESDIFAAQRENRLAA